MNATQIPRIVRRGVQTLSLGGVGAGLLTVMLSAPSAAAASTAGPGCFFGVHAAPSAAAPDCGGPVLHPPTVTEQPAGLTVPAGTPVSFVSSANGSPQPTQQWVESTDGGLTWSPMYGSTGTTISMTAELADNGEEFESVFANSEGTVDSDPATLTVNAAMPTITAVTSSANPVLAGGATEYTANVWPAPDGGTLTFLDGATAIDGCGSLSAEGGTATCDVTYPNAGSHVITATYSGDLSYDPSESTAVNQAVNSAPGFVPAGTPRATVDERYSHRFATTGAPTPTVAVQSGELPPGLTLTGDGVLSGTPTAAGVFSFSLRADNGYGVVAFDHVHLAVRALPTVAVALSSTGKRAMVFVVRLSRPSTSAVTVRWRTVAGSAVAGSDYRSGHGRLRIAAGRTRALVRVRILRPAEHRTLRVSLHAPIGARLGSATAVGTI